MEGGKSLDLATHLRLDLKGHARLRGTVVHAWCEAVEWLDGDAFDEAFLLHRARKEAPGLQDHRLREWFTEYQLWMKADSIREVLSRGAYPAGARVERELPFLHRLPDGILQGYIDRLVLLEEEGRVVAAEVLDFKTDQIDESDAQALEDRIAHYRPQIDAYGEAVAGRYGLEMEQVTGKLLFLRLGLVREV